jgi:hypothetical protein
LLLTIDNSVSEGFCRSSGGGKVWGSDEVNVEGWKPLKRLTGHESGAFSYFLP